MTASESTGVVELPKTLRAKLEDYRGRFRRIKMTEAVLVAAFGLVVSYLLILGSDRLFDTPAWMRLMAMVAGVGGAIVLLPLTGFRWVWGSRRLDQVARVLLRKDARTGDELLGILELTDSRREFDRSPALCRAAVQQVDESVASRDLSAALPDSRRRTWSKALALPMLVVVASAVMMPEAASNALARWLRPLADIDRYTFAKTNRLPDEWVVARGEPFQLEVELDGSSRWRPETGRVRFADGLEIESPLVSDRYDFELPARTRREVLEVTIGDAHHEIDLQPLDRPSIIALVADVTLPEYLGVKEARARDLRGGSITVVKGSRLSLSAELSRELRSATLDGRELAVDGDRISTSESLVSEFGLRTLTWIDVHGLSEHEPFEVAVRAVDDEAPSLFCDGLERLTIMLDTETLSFTVQAADDFGLGQLGLEWEGEPDPIDNPEPSRGDRVIAAGAPGQNNLEAMAAFAPDSLGIPAQTLTLRAWVKDAFPDRGRIYSAPYRVVVMTPEDHMIWLTKRLERWLDQAIEVRDHELELFQTNKDLRRLAAADIEKPENLRRLQQQVAGERANGRRLTGLVNSGGDLLSQAARNAEFNVNTMNDWAEMLKILEDIAKNRMPSVADLLAQARSKAIQATSVPSGPVAGTVRGDSGGKSGESPPVTKAGQVPQVVDVESGFNQPTDDEGGKGRASKPRLTLPGTILAAAGGGDEPPEADEPPPSEDVDEAVEKQEELLAEFAKVAGKIDEILRNLMGSTFVKRLKAASRSQTAVAKDVNPALDGSFGLETFRTDDRAKRVFEEVSERETRSSSVVSVIQSDMAAYTDRLEGREDQFKFKDVLGEMKESRVTRELVSIGEDAKRSFGGDATVAAEFWADTLDRWAEQLVGPG